MATDFKVSNDKVFFYDEWNQNTVIVDLADGLNEVDGTVFSPVLDPRRVLNVAFSLYGRFVALNDAGGTVDIYKNGAALQTLTPDSATPSIEGIGMSYEGRYVFFCDRANRELTCYEGA
ncbi:MAG: hypothetical protein ACYS1A_16635 [Planctomycetota bacterium]